MGQGPPLLVYRMNITRPELKEITETIEDTVQYVCDNERLSGELVWTIVECLATAKIAELKGLVKAD